MTEQEERLHAALAEVVRQRDEAQARSANFSGDLRIAQNRIAELEKKLAGEHEPVTDNRT